MAGSDSIFYGSERWRRGGEGQEDGGVADSRREGGAAVREMDGCEKGTGAPKR